MLRVLGERTTKAPTTDRGTDARGTFGGRRHAFNEYFVDCFYFIKFNTERIPERRARREASSWRLRRRVVAPRFKTPVQVPWLIHNLVPTLNRRVIDDGVRESRLKSPQRIDPHSARTSSCDSPVHVEGGEKVVRFRSSGLPNSKPSNASVSPPLDLLRDLIRRVQHVDPRSLRRIRLAHLGRPSVQRQERPPSLSRRARLEAPTTRHRLGYDRSAPYPYASSTSSHRITNSLVPRCLS